MLKRNVTLSKEELDDLTTALTIWMSNIPSGHKTMETLEKLHRKLLKHWRQTRSGCEHVPQIKLKWTGDELFVPLQGKCEKCQVDLTAVWTWTEAT